MYWGSTGADRGEPEPCCAPRREPRRSSLNEAGLWPPPGAAPPPAPLPLLAGIAAAAVAAPAPAAAGARPGVPTDAAPFAGPVPGRDVDEACRPSSILFIMAILPQRTGGWKVWEILLPTIAGIGILRICERGSQETRGVGWDRRGWWPGLQIG